MNTIPLTRTPSILQTFQWILNPIGYMQRNFSRHGDVFQAPIVWSSATPYCFLSEPEAIQYILTHDTGKKLSSPGELNNVLESLIGRQNVILFSGKRHRERRQLVMPPFQHKAHLAK